MASSSIRQAVALVCVLPLLACARSLTTTYNYQRELPGTSHHQSLVLLPISTRMMTGEFASNIVSQVLRRWMSSAR